MLAHSGVITKSDDHEQGHMEAHTGTGRFFGCYVLSEAMVQDRKISTEGRSGCQISQVL